MKLSQIISREFKDCGYYNFKYKFKVESFLYMAVFYTELVKCFCCPSLHSSFFSNLKLQEYF